MDHDATSTTQPYPPPPYQPAPPAQRKAKRKKWPWIVGAVVLIIVIASVANSGKSSTTPAAQPGAPAASAGAQPAAPDGQPGAASPADDAGGGSTVVYEVTGSGRASVTYSKEGFSQEQQANTKLPFRKVIEFSEQVGQFMPLSVVAQHTSGSGDITCTITVDGKQVQTSTSSGQYALVTCNGAG